MHSRHNFSNGPTANSVKNQYQYNNANGNGRYIHPHGHPNTLKPLMSSAEQDDPNMMSTTPMPQHPQYLDPYDNLRHQLSEENSSAVSSEGIKYPETIIAIKCEESATNASDPNDIEATTKTPVCIINEMVRSSKVSITFHFLLHCSLLLN